MVRVEALESIVNEDRRLDLIVDLQLKPADLLVDALIGVVLAEVPNVCRVYNQDDAQRQKQRRIEEHPHARRRQVDVVSYLRQRLLLP